MKEILRNYCEINKNLGPNQWQILENQGEDKLLMAEPMKIDWCKVSIVLIPLTISIIGLLLLKYYKWFRVVMLWQYCPVRSATHLYMKGTDGSDQIFRIQDKKYGRIFFFKKLKYKITDDSTFLPMGYPYMGKFEQYNASSYQKTGLDEESIQNSRDKFGENDHIVQLPSYLEYLFDVLTTPLFLLQYLNCVIFILQQSYIFAGILFFVTWLSTTFNFYILHRSFTQIKHIAQKVIQVKVIRDSRKIQIDSTQLVPGDIYFPQKEIMCDCILLKGDIFLNQANISGQSIPIGKFPAVSVQSLAQKNRWLYEGSSIISNRNSVALVVHTGFTSHRGRIVRKIMERVIEKPALITNMLWFMLQVFVVSQFIFIVTLPWILRIHIDPIMVFIMFFDYMAFGFPPPMPIFINFAYGVCLVRLLYENILCTQPHKTVESSNIQTICFDKTGTLTENQVQIGSVMAFNPIKQSKVTQYNSKNSIIFKLFACCHSIQQSQGKMLGDQIDMKMFEFSNFKMSKPNDLEIQFQVTNDKGDHLKILRINQYESSHQSMSVLVQDCTLNKYFIFAKGAPEKIQQKCVQKVLYEDDLIETISLKGLRSIFYGFKEVNQQLIQQYLEANRDIYLDGVNTLGLITFDNKLKEEAISTIMELKQAEIESIMLTGDNIYVAIQIAAKAGLIKKQQTMVILQGSMQDQNIREKQGKFIATVLKIRNNQIIKSEEYIDEQAISQRSYDQPIIMNADFLMLKPKPKLPKGVRIFARASPLNKAYIIKTLKQTVQKQFEERSMKDQWFGSLRRKIAMVGDGANDLIALRQADIGFATSSSDASYGATFIIKNLSDICKIIRYGKCTQQNLIEGYRYYGIVIFIRIALNLIMLQQAAYFSENSHLFTNLSITIIIPVAMFLNKPIKPTSKLSPCSNFLGLENHLIFWGTSLIYILGFIIAYYNYRNSEQFKSTSPNSVTYQSKYDQLNQTSTVCWLLILIPSVMVSFIMYKSDPWKKKIWYNPILCFLLGYNMIIICVFFFITENLQILEIVAISNSETVVLLIIMLITTVVVMIYNCFLNSLNFHSFQEQSSSTQDDHPPLTTTTNLAT